MDSLRTSDMPKISIVMPLFNKEADVLDSIASIQAQAFTDWELVVVDDGSTDAGPDKVLSLNDPRIRIHRQANAGVSAARNQGIELAKSELIAFLDADDLWFPGFLASIHSLSVDYPAAQWLATGYQKQDSQGNITPVRLRGLPSGFTRGILELYFVIAMQSDPPVCSSAMAVKRGAIKAIGGFPVGIKSGEDLLTWGRLALRFPLAYDIRCQSVFQISGIERRPDPAQRVTQEYKILLSQYADVPGFRSYVALWCRMQAVMALRFNETALARHSAMLSFRYGPLQFRNGYTLVLTYMPTGLRATLDSFLRKLARILF